jgi:hypothetical protein
MPTRDLDEFMGVATLIVVGAMACALIAYNVFRFFVGFWEGLNGIEPPNPNEPRGFPVIQENAENGGGNSAAPVTPKSASGTSSSAIQWSPTPGNGQAIDRASSGEKPNRG